MVEVWVEVVWFGKGLEQRWKGKGVSGWLGGWGISGRFTIWVVQGVKLGPWMYRSWVEVSWVVGLVLVPIPVAAPQ